MPSSKLAQLLQRSAVRGKIWKCSISKNRVWGCSWKSCEHKVGWSCYKHLARVFCSWIGWVLCQLLCHRGSGDKWGRREENPIWCSKVRRNSGSFSHWVWCLCQWGQNCAWSGTTVGTLLKIKSANRLANTQTHKERGHVFTTSIDFLVCDQEHHSQGSGAQHGRCDWSVLHWFDNFQPLWSVTSPEL